MEQTQTNCCTSKNRYVYKYAYLKLQLYVNLPYSNWIWFESKMLQMKNISDNIFVCEDVIIT